MQEEVLNMPVQHLGQLKPTMQQQIALQEALLALQRRDEELRRRAEPKTALGQRLSGGENVQAIPLTGRTERDNSTLAKPYFRPGAGTLEEALRAAQPSPEGAPTAQTEAWKLRDKMVAGREDKANAGADEMYKRILESRGC